MNPNPSRGRGASEEPNQAPIAYAEEPALAGARAQPGINRRFGLAVLLSLLVHLILWMVSTRLEVSDGVPAEPAVERIFRVSLRNAESLDILGRPAADQLRLERERALQDELEAARDGSALDPAGALEDSLPGLGDLPLPPAPGLEGIADAEGLNDAPARNLITAEDGARAVEQFENNALGDAVFDPVESAPIALSGRGGFSRRLAEGLSGGGSPGPPPPLSIGVSLIRGLPEPGAPPPMEAPPLELPPEREILPAPAELTADPAPLLLEREEEAVRALRERFVVLDDLLRVDLLTYHHVGGDGYFMIRVRPFAGGGRLQPLPKDVVFALDASAGMGRLTVGTLRDGIMEAVGRLRPNDRFNVVGVDRTARVFAEGLAPVNDTTLSEARRFVRGLSASGGAGVYPHLEPLLELGTGRARPLIVLLFSDGQPGGSVNESRRLINEVSRFAAPSSTIYALGTGQEINRHLLGMLAYRNRGRAWFEPDRAALPDMMRAVFGYVENPALLRVEADFEGVDESEIYPKELPDLFLQGELNLWGRLTGNERRIQLRLVGEAFDDRKELITPLEIPEFDNGTYEVARGWARAKIYHLSGLLTGDASNRDILDEIDFLSQTYRVDIPGGAAGLR